MIKNFSNINNSLKRKNTNFIMLQNLKNTNKNENNHFFKIFFYNFTEKINLNEDYYKTLGLKPEANEKEIKTAYLKMVKKFHPDITGGKSTEFFKEISTSYEILSDKNKKRFYDSNSEIVYKYNYKTSNFEDKNKKNYQYYHFENEDSEFKNNSDNNFYNKYHHHKYYNSNRSYDEEYKKKETYNLPDFIYMLKNQFYYYSAFLGKFLCFFMIYLFYLLIKSRTKNEYHLFSDLY